jgi:hypothetical protein
MEPRRIGASGRRLQRGCPQQRSRSTKRKKIGRCGFQLSSRYTNRRPVRTIWHGNRTKAGSPRCAICTGLSRSIAVGWGNASEKGVPEDRASFRMDSGITRCGQPRRFRGWAPHRTRRLRRGAGLPRDTGSSGASRPLSVGFPGARSASCSAFSHAQGSGNWSLSLPAWRGWRRK